jgi:hypothetical protein
MNEPLFRVLNTESKGFCDFYRFKEATIFYYNRLERKEPYVLILLNPEWLNNFAQLALEARDALPAIPLHSARLHNVSLTLADRIEDKLKPWLIE